jgi:hypothetical protein
MGVSEDAASQSRNRRCDGGRDTLVWVRLSKINDYLVDNISACRLSEVRSYGQRKSAGFTAEGSGRGPKSRKPPDRGTRARNKNPHPVSPKSGEARVGHLVGKIGRKGWARPCRGPSLGVSGFGEGLRCLRMTAGRRSFRKGGPSTQNNPRSRKARDLGHPLIDYRGGRFAVPDFSGGYCLIAHPRRLDRQDTRG